MIINDVRVVGGQVDGLPAAHDSGSVPTHARVLRNNTRNVSKVPCAPK